MPGAFWAFGRPARTDLITLDNALIGNHKKLVRSADLSGVSEIDSVRAAAAWRPGDLLDLI